MNNVNKNKVAKHFGGKALSYESVTPVQKKMADELAKVALDFFANRGNPKRILEIGCGTGRLTSYLLEQFPDAEISALDIAPQMVEATQQRCPLVKVIQTDAEAFLKSCSNEYDLIISNATFQWFDDVPTAISDAKSLLSEGGLLAIASFGLETFRELKQAFNEAYKELTKEPQTHVLEMIDTHAIWRYFPEARLEDDIIQLEFDNVRQFLHSLQQAGVVNAGKSIRPLQRDVLLRMLANYKHYFSNDKGDSIVATYHTFQLQIGSGI